MKHLYHVANQEVRNSIQEKGLIGHEIKPIWNHALNPQPRGNYCFESVEAAIQYGELLTSPSKKHKAKYTKYDVWQVDSTGLLVFYDPEDMLGKEEKYEEKCFYNQCSHRKEEYARWYIPELVPPNHLKLMEPQECYIKQFVEDVDFFCHKRIRMNPLPLWQS